MRSPLETGGIPAAQYVRMSTEHQQYSTFKQEDIIREYSAARGYGIVRTYADEGKSGLNVAGRESLRRMIDDVQSGQAQFSAILVYDVSRWGRFQDADESAYYEYLCKRAGIEVHYCAEQFENDGGPTSTIIKSVKRSLAVFEFAQNAAEIWRRSKMPQKREILESVSLNRLLGDVTLVVKKRKPFDVLAERPLVTSSRDDRI